MSERLQVLDEMAVQPYSIAAMQIRAAETQLRAPTLKESAAGGLAVGVLFAGVAMGSEPKTTVTTGAPEVTVVSASSSAAAKATASVNERVILSFRSATGTPRAEKKRMEAGKQRCTIEDKIWNSGSRLNGNRNNPSFFPDSRDTIVCKSPSSPTGLVKVGLPKNKNVLKDGFQPEKDIIPGTDCFNIVKYWENKPKPSVIVRNPILVRSFDESVKVEVKVGASARADCGEGTYASGSGEGRAVASIRLREIIKARGVDGALTAKTMNEVNAKASASASADAHCERTEVTTPPTTPPVKPNLPPTVTMVKPEHMIVSGLTSVCAFAKDPDGPSDIATVVFTNPGNLGNFMSTERPGDEEGEVCVDYFAGTTPGTSELKVIATDKAGNFDEDVKSFAVVQEGATDPRGVF